MSKSYLFFFLISFILFSCEGDTLPKPQGNLRLEYPKATYQETNFPCPFSFKKSKLAIITPRKEKCWFTISYPKMKANIHVTYLPVNNNIENLIKESQKLVYEHTIRASAIKPKQFLYPEKKVYGNLYELAGESASNIHFYLTDSTNHFLEANVYFNVRPNPDSLAPAVKYISNDVLTLIDSFEWKK
ncbi:MAG: gliding motility lipoprotein GldD [Flavobacteriales bacterium]|nr:gliding motility lipoprotein GldD [Flavobacteriales bacterium]